MGQKTNPNILRVGKIKEWKSKYVEKKSTESSTLIFRDLEMKKFVYRLFSKNELRIQNCRLYYSESSLHVYVSYYTFFRPSLSNKKFNSKYTSQHSKQFYNKTFNIKKNNKKRQLYIAKTYKSDFLRKTGLNPLKNHYFLDKKTQRLNILNDTKIYEDVLKYKTLDHQHTNLFVSKILKGLILFTNQKHDIFLNFKQINRETPFFQTVSKKNKHKLKETISELRKFQRKEFFKEGFNMLTAFTMNTHSSSFLAEFIARHLKKLKRPNFFIRFLKISLQTLMNQKFSKFKRIKIKIKGRFNVVPRSKHRFIIIGRNIPVLKLSAKIDYGESVAYTSNGTFGVKIWTHTKTYKNYYFQCTHHVKQSIKKYEKVN